MAFFDIYNEVAGLTGITDVNKRPFVLSIINRAAEDLYSQSDLVNCLREQVFIKNSTTTPEVLQFTLPWYVWKIRGMREYNTGLQIINHDMRPRYQTQGWREMVDPLLYRIKSNQLTARDSLNEGPLTINLPTGEVVSADGAFSFSAGGSNSSRSKFIEQVDFVAGDSSKITTALFSTIDVLRKVTPTEFDLYILDANGEELSFIPNSELGPNYTLIQVADYAAWNPMYIEVLYKTRFTPFKNDYDEFPCGNLYDKAIVYKAAENYYITYRKDFEKAAAFYTKACEVVRNIAADFSDNNEKLIDFGANKYLNMAPHYGGSQVLNPFYRYGTLNR